MNKPLSPSLNKTPLRQVKDVRTMLFNQEAFNQLQMVAASELRPERMMRLMANAIRTTPKLGQCEPLSLLGALMQCASLGLEPNTLLGHAYLIPFDNKRKGITEVQLVIGYKGMVDLARRSGHIVNIIANVVYDDDEHWSYEYGTNQHLSHKPGPREGKPTHAYAYAKLTDGDAFIVLPWAHILKTRNNSQGYKTAIRYGKKDTPWIMYEAEMAAKTAIRQLFKFLPISIERVTQAMEVDERGGVDFAGYAMDPESYIDMPEINGDGEILDDEGGDEEAGQSPEADEAPEPETKPEPKPKPKAEPKPEPKPEPKAEPKPEPEDDPEPEAEPEQEPDEGPDETLAVMRARAHSIIKDIREAPALLDDLLDHHEMTIGEIKKHYPDLHKELQAEIKKVSE